MWICKDRSGRLQTPQVEKGLKCLTAQCNGVDQESLSRSTGKRCYLASLFISLFYRSSKLLIVAHYGSKGVFLPAAIICPSQFITGANQEFTIAERQLKWTWAWTNRTFHFDTFLPKIEVHSKSFGF